MSRYLVTGANGMLGRHVLSVLSENKNTAIPVTRQHWDITQWKTCEEMMEQWGNVDAVFHVAANAPNGDTVTPELHHLLDANVRSVLNLCEWCLTTKIPLVFISGATVYADPHALNIQEDDQKVDYGLGGFYGYTKYLAEQVIAHFSAKGMNTIILRPSSIYGDGLSSATLVSKLFSQAEKDQVLKVTGADNKINFVHAYDVARAAFEALQRQRWGTYNIASSQMTSIGTLATEIVNTVGKGKVEIQGDNTGNKPFQRFDLSCAKAQRSFDFQSEISISDGLKMISQKRLLHVKY